MLLHIHPAPTTLTMNLRRHMSIAPLIRPHIAEQRAGRRDQRQTIRRIIHRRFPRLCSLLRNIPQDNNFRSLLPFFVSVSVGIAVCRVAFRIDSTTPGCGAGSASFSVVEAFGGQGRVHVAKEGAEDRDALHDYSACYFG